VTAASFYWKDTLINIDDSIGDAIKSLNKSGLKIVLVQNKKQIFQGTITDGDIRRALINGMTIDTTVDRIANRNAITTSESVSKKQISDLMAENNLEQLPIIDQKNKVIGLHMKNQNLSTSNLIANTMVIMAGGLGARLRPLTFSTPKPMLEVAGKPILQLIIEQAKFQGISNFVITINYLGALIEEYFGNGEKFGVKINYLKESEPLGTAGSLAEIEFTRDLPILVSNADIVSDVDYRDLINFHIEKKSDFTVSVKPNQIVSAFGELKLEGLKVKEYVEKPVYFNIVNAGIYVVDINLINLVPKGIKFDMSTLISKALAENLKVFAYPLHENWSDIGRIEDYNNVNQKLNLAE
jgi:dTDP-glucose pyrophosphorylase/predicted transcriptional regulator